MPYEDVRDFQAEHWQRRPALTMSILRARKGYLIDERTQRSIQKTTQQMISQARSVHTSGSTVAGNPAQGAQALLAGSANAGR
jgi:hypothetical protein